MTQEIHSSSGKGDIVEIGLFAHNEAGGIREMLSDLARQDIFADGTINCRVHVLSNGCTDETVAQAQSMASSFSDGVFVVHDLPAGGKSRTWNRFVHALSRPDATYLAFLDADIELPDTETLSRLLAFLSSDPAIAATGSRPVKDIVQRPINITLQDKLIARAGGTLNDWRRAICGQFYIMRTPVARGFHLPIGLPVEDGFVHAMISTEVMTSDPVPRVFVPDGVYHVYQSERSISSLISHQTRIVVGSAINATVFRHLRSSGRPPAELLRIAAEDPDWLAELLPRYLPDRRFGYVPTAFLFKRLRRPAQGLQAHGVRIIGFVFDAIVWVNAQIKMARGAGSGYW